MIIIGKHIGGITINPLEYLLDDNGKPLEFATVGEAMAFLREKGFTGDALDALVLRELPVVEPLTKAQLMDAYAGISKMEDLLTEAGELYAQLPTVIRDTILDYHSESATVEYCLRWGLQALRELREDWHTLVAGIPYMETGADATCRTKR